MNERGQVFTLDMFFALTLAALIVSYSGLALEQANKQAEDYAFRYSLERAASDAADVLVKTSGRPNGWENNITTLEVPGLAENIGVEPIQNKLYVKRLASLRELCRSEEWDPAKSEVQAVTKLFGGYENFEIRITSGDNTLWDFWPGWDNEVSSGAENSLEVVVARRLIFMGYGEVEHDTGTIEKTAGGRVEFPPENFMVEPGELDLYDWYLFLLVSEPAGLPVDVYINSSPSGPSTHRFNTPHVSEGDTWPDEHGGMDIYLHEGVNTVQIVSLGQKDTWLRLYILAVPACSPPGQVRLAMENFSVTLEVKLWR